MKFVHVFVTRAIAVLSANLYILLSKPFYANISGLVTLELLFQSVDTL